MVPYDDGAMARDEIDRCAGNPHFGQILVLSRTSEPLGKRRYWPIFEAACRHDLPVGVHVFGYSGYPVTGAGWPSYYIEEMSGHSTTCQTLVASLVLEGVFEHFPTLKVVLIEGGFGWLPALAWRLDRQVQRSRDEVPHLTRRPSEYVRDHIWITTQPMEEPERREHVLDADGLDRLRPAAVRDRLPALGLRRSGPGPARAGSTPSGSRWSAAATRASSTGSS